METRKNHTKKDTRLINIDGKLITNQQLIAKSFNNYFLSVADKITNSIRNYKNLLNSNDPIHYIHKNL